MALYGAPLLFALQRAINNDQIIYMYAYLRCIIETFFVVYPYA